MMMRIWKNTERGIVQTIAVGMDLGSGEYAEAEVRNNSAGRICKGLCSVTPVSDAVALDEVQSG